MTQNHHEILGVEPSASDAEIREAYRRKAQQYHPDKVQHLGPEFAELAERRMREINEAFEALTDPNGESANQEPEREERAASQPTDKAQTGFWPVLAVVALVSILAVVVVWRWRAPSKPSVTPESELTRAELFYRQGNWDAAYARVVAATEGDGTRVEAWDLRWKIERELGMGPQAAESLERAISLAPSDVQRRVDHARLRFYLGDLAKARVELTWLKNTNQDETLKALIAELVARDPDRAERLAELD